MQWSYWNRISFILHKVLMNQETYLKKFKETVDKMYEITKAKNADYAWENSTDAFKNFRVIEQLWWATTEQWFLTRISDKFTRIINLTKQTNHVQDEKIEDTLLDMANYCILFKLYLDSKSIDN